MLQNLSDVKSEEVKEEKADEEKPSAPASAKKKTAAQTPSLVKRSSPVKLPEAQYKVRHHHHLSTSPINI